MNKTVYKCTSAQTAGTYTDYTLLGVVTATIIIIMTKRKYSKTPFVSYQNEINDGSFILYLHPVPTIHRIILIYYFRKNFDSNTICENKKKTKKIKNYFIRRTTSSSAPFKWWNTKRERKHGNKNGWRDNKWRIVQIHIHALLAMAFYYYYLCPRIRI